MEEKNDDDEEREKYQQQHVKQAKKAERGRANYVHKQGKLKNAAENIVMWEKREERGVADFFFAGLLAAVSSIAAIVIIIIR